MAYLRAFRADTMSQYEVVRELKFKRTSLPNNTYFKEKRDLSRKIAVESKKLSKLVYRDLEAQLERKRVDDLINDIESGE